MRKLNTIQKVENLNIVKAIDEKGNGNANHLYKIEAIVPDDEDIPFTLIQFQNGARKDPAAITGIIDTDESKFQNSKGLERWAIIRNMQEASKIINLLTEKGVSSVEELEEKLRVFGDKSYTMCKNKYILWIAFSNHLVKDVFSLLNELTLSSQGKQILTYPPNKNSR